jgi:hypothetical protein
MPKMRAKMKIHNIINQSPTSETLQLGAVCAAGYPADGSDEDNTFAKFTPSASMSIQINNPDLVGKFAVGQVYYLDFVPAD